MSDLRARLEAALQRLRRRVPVACALILVAHDLPAQCPDGTPPPCASRATSAPNSVAVLYFDNLSRDTSDAYLADGMTEELISRLSQVERLQVKSRIAPRDEWIVYWSRRAEFDPIRHEPRFRSVLLEASRP